jgi:hypothetical protein
MKLFRHTVFRRATVRRSVGVTAALLALGAVLAAPATAAAAPATHTSFALVHLRVEGANSTLFEGLVLTFPHDVTTAEGGTHECDGTNNGANPTPGPTATGALDTAATHHGFTIDGAFFPAFDDYLIDQIAGESPTGDNFWEVLLNGNETLVGGCQQRVQTGQDIVWAITDGSEPVLKLTGPLTAHVGVPATYTVTDEGTGAPVAGATVGGATTAANGTASVTFTSAGLNGLKATRTGDIRSNLVRTLVLP